MAGMRRPVLLTVDDHESLHEYYALGCEHGYEQICAHGGYEALELLRSKTIDAMILDLMMPDLNGLEVLERALAMKPRLTVVISSLIDASETALRAIRRGACDYFVKPTDPEVMEMVVRQLLAHRGDPAIELPQPALVARRVLVVGPDPGFRAALTVALQPCCRVDPAARVSVAIEMLGRIMPDLAIVDLRSASANCMHELASLRAKFPEGPMIVVGPADRIGPCLESTAGHPEVLVQEPVDYELLFDEIATMLRADPDAPRPKHLSRVTSAAVERVVARYPEHALRVEHLSAGTRLSLDHFAHVFSEEMGISPMEYVSRVRTQAAIFMLRETSEKVGIIARRLGFFDGPHLATVLRRRSLGRPTEFRLNAPI